MTRTCAVYSDPREGPRLPIPNAVTKARGPTVPERQRPASLFDQRAPSCFSACPAQQAAQALPRTPDTAPAVIETTSEGKYRTYRKMCQDAVRDEAKLFSRMSEALAAGKTKAAKQLQLRYLNSLDAKIVATLQARADLRRKRKSVPAGKALIEAAKAVNAYVDTGETVTVFRKEKGAGRYRIIHDFRLIQRARQRLVRRALQPFVQLDPRQYMTGNGGREAACQKVVDLLPTYPFVAEVDIKEFFPSLDRDRLRRALPIDGRVTSSTILLDDADKIARTRTDRETGETTHIDYYDGMGPISLVQDSQDGLPQGAATSPLVADHVVSEIMKDIPAGVPIVNFGDNFLVMGRTRVELDQALKLLVAAVMRRPLGHLSLIIKQRRRSADGFDFLGYRFRTRRGRPTAMPAQKNVDKLQRGVANKLRRLAHGPDVGDKMRAKVKRLVQSWTAAFPLCRSLHSMIFGFLRDLFLAVPGGDTLRCEILVACVNPFERLAFV